MKTHCLPKELLGLPFMTKTLKGIYDLVKLGKVLSQPRKNRDGSASKFIEIEIASLPIETRQALATKNTKVGYDLPAVQAAATTAAQIKLSADNQEKERQAARAESLVMFEKLPDWQKTGANAKMVIIKACHAYVTSHRLAKKHGQDQFAHEYVLGRIDVAPWVRDEIQHLHPGTLRGWIASEYNLGMMGLVNLHGNRKDQGKIETWNKTTLPDGSETAPMAEVIQALILKHPHINQKKCNEALRGLLPNAPRVNDKTVKRYMDKWKMKNVHQFALANNPDDYKNRHQPAFGSRSEGIDGPNQLWEIDATPADLLLTDGQRYKILGVTDVGTARLKYYVNKTEKARDNAFIVRNCILDWGVPTGGTLATDQGAPYISEHFERILSDLDIHHHICAPFSGDEKPHIERSFRTFSHDLIELTPGYCGHNVADRKAIDSRKTFAQRLMTRGETIEVSIGSAELQAFIDRWTANYHNTVHSRLGKTPNQALSEWPYPISVISDVRALDMLLVETARRGGRLPIIGKKGIRVNGGFYIHPALGIHTGARCRAFQDPTDLGRIIVHITNEHDVWEFLCIAEDPKRTGISMAEVATATRALHNEHKKEISRLTRETRKALKGVDVVDAVMSYREKEAATAQGNVTYMPRPTVEYTTPGLTAAREAADALDGTVKPVATPALTPDQQAMKERLKAEFEAKQNTNVRSLETESRNVKYQRMKRLREILTAGGDIATDEYDALRRYELTNEFLAMKGMEEDRKAMK
ncbi:MAG: transposase [Deltaproteobacteria bacterium]|nr:transposase [Deltaproteobacteria bacterium]